MFIKQFKYAADNFGYLVYSENIGIAIDAGAVEDTLSFAQQNGIDIKYVTNTHSHYDHIPGNQALLKKINAQFIDCKSIKSDQNISLGKESLEVFFTPGHSDDSIVFKADGFLVTGDTLFNGTIGNCFTGDFNAFFLSLKRLISFPGSTEIYAGHDYVMEAMEIARSIEKDNPHIEKYIRSLNCTPIVSTLDDELLVNPYIRFNAPVMIDNLKTRGVPVSTEFERFKSIMAIY
ncbi:MAG: MBL fold metallo-hydrolase [Desulfobacteraceae bacterium]|nr:MBL fold metallo-hydrolase [Desulfobacteraceae bacterium]